MYIFFKSLYCSNRSVLNSCEFSPSFLLYHIEAIDVISYLLLQVFFFSPTDELSLKSPCLLRSPGHFLQWSRFWLWSSIPPTFFLYFRNYSKCTNYNWYHRCINTRQFVCFLCSLARSKCFPSFSLSFIFHPAIICQFTVFTYSATNRFISVTTSSKLAILQHIINFCFNIFGPYSIILCYNKNIFNFFQQVFPS